MADAQRHCFSWRNNTSITRRVFYVFSSGAPFSANLLYVFYVCLYKETFCYMLLRAFLGASSSAFFFPEDGVQFLNNWKMWSTSMNSFRSSTTRWLREPLWPHWASNARGKHQIPNLGSWRHIARRDNVEIGWPDAQREHIFSTTFIPL